MKILKSVKEFHIVLNFTNRKWKMITWELTLFIVFMGFYSVISALFPIENVPLDETLGDQYVFYMLLMLLDLLIAGSMFFVLGIWFQDWKMEKRLTKNEKPVEDIHAVDLAQEEKGRLERDHSN